MCDVSEMKSLMVVVMDGFNQNVITRISAKVFFVKLVSLLSSISQ